MALNRRTIREKVMQVLYAYEITHDPIEPIVKNVFEDILQDNESMGFAYQLIEKVISNVNEIDGKIRSRVNNWEFKRLAIIDKILLRIAICEFLFFPDIPPKVTLNEAIEIAKKFSTDKSSKFINGILDAVLISLNETDSMHKTGRGLMNKSIKKDTDEQ
jgi:N utilization substance protein B